MGGGDSSKKRGLRGVFRPHCLLRIFQDGLYRTKSGRSREFIVSDKAEYFCLREEGRYTIFRKVTFLLKYSSLKCH